MFPNVRLCKALLDRITDRAHIIETGTESYRFRRTLEKRQKSTKPADKEKSTKSVRGSKRARKRIDPRQAVAYGSCRCHRPGGDHCNSLTEGVGQIRRSKVGQTGWTNPQEGYGIGGHAILAMPGSKGCWHCAYVDLNALTRGLTSNLNFLKPGQGVMRNLGGCGTQFLPYSGIAASCTATMAADLSVRFLAGEVMTSSKVSWKGGDAEAMRASREVTWRYRYFGESLRILPLHDENCDLCGG